MSNLYGQDSVTASNTAKGLSVYAGYVNGYVSYGSMVARHPGARVLSISVRNGTYGVDVLDVEPGAATESAMIPFLRSSPHAHVGKPVIYCAAWQVTTFVNYLARNGHPRSSYYIWSAHYGRGLHYCGPHTCGFGQADATQYASNAYYDSDVWQSYMFTGSGGGGNVTPVAVPKNYPVSQGDTGPLVVALQGGLDKWRSRTGSALLTVNGKYDGKFGPATKAAVVKAQEYFLQRGVTAGTANQALMDQMAYALWPVKQGMQGVDVVNLQKNLNKWNGVLKFGKALTPDGEFGPATAAAVAKAQAHFGEHGITAGYTTQNVYDKLEGNPS